MDDSSRAAGHDEETFKVGIIAAATGLTVRALHHYDALGLCSPSRHAANGHRLYTAQDVTRLYRVALLRRLGLPLPEIAAALDAPQWQLRPAIRQHLTDTTDRLAATARLRARLAAMQQQFDHAQQPSTEELFATLEEMSMLEAPVRATTALLVYDDPGTAQDYLVAVFGLTAGPRVLDAAGRIVHAEVQAGDQVLWLHPAAIDYRSPRSLGAVTGMTVVVVDDADAHHARAVSEGAEIVEDLVDQGYGVREYGARDLEGQLWFFHSPLG